MPGEERARPVIILSPDQRNLLAQTVIVVPCSTTPRYGRWHVRLRRGEGGLAQDCVAKCEEVTAVAKHRVQPRPLGGPLSSERLDELRDALLHALAFT